MSEQEARATIEQYENTFGKELRRRTFRTWNDWSKAEEEFAPKDGSLRYVKLSTAFLLIYLHISFIFDFRAIIIVKHRLMIVLNRKTLFQQQDKYYYQITMKQNK